MSTSTTSACQPCPTDMKTIEPPKMTQTDFKNSLESLIKAAGIGPCKNFTSASNRTKTDAFGVDWLLGLSKATKTSADISSSATGYSVGCEALAITTQKYYNATQRVMQILDCSCNIMKVDVVAGNNVRIKAKNSEIRCNININQTIDVKVATENSISETSQNQITTEVNNFINQAIDNIVFTEAEAGGISTGSKTFTDIDTKVLNQTYYNNVKNAVQESLLAVKTTNGVEIDLESSVLTGEECNINQDIIIYLTAKNIMNRSLSNVFQDTNIQDALQKVSTMVKSKAKGVADITEKAGKVATDLTLAAWADENQGLAIVLIVVVIIVIILLLK